MPEPNEVPDRHGRPAPFRLQEHIAALRDPCVFGVADARVEIIETHLSVVCLAGDRAWKFKKAVSFPFVDFRAAYRREQACRQELELNRRLAPEVYLDVVPLRRTTVGLRVGDAAPAGGDVVDHGVLMVRLPAERMLDRMLRDDAVEGEEIATIGRQLASFHAGGRADDAEARGFGSADPLLEQIDANFEDCRPFSGEPPHTTFDAGLLEAVRERVERRFGVLRGQLIGRDGYIVDGHGDLHAANICMTQPPTLYDCIEFRRDFRCADAAADVAFLAMDLRGRGRPDLAEDFVAAYVATSGDDDLPALLPELVRYRAMVRAKVDAFAAADTGRAAIERRRLESSARRHLLLCAWTLLEEGPPVAILGSGLPGSGKSTLMRALMRSTGWRVFESDVLRKQLFGVAPTAKLPGAAYATTASDRVYELLVEGATEQRGCVLLDANYRERERRQWACERLREAGFAPVMLHVECDDALARERLRRRHRSRRHTSDADEAIYDRMAREQQPPRAEEGAPVLQMDGGERAVSNLQRLGAQLLATVPDPLA